MAIRNWSDDIFFSYQISWLQIFIFQLKFVKLKLFFRKNKLNEEFILELYLTLLILKFLLNFNVKNFELLSVTIIKNIS